MLDIISNNMWTFELIKRTKAKYTNFFDAGGRNRKYNNTYHFVNRIGRRYGYRL